jgi:hypothetical protein
VRDIVAKTLGLSRSSYGRLRQRKPNGGNAKVKSVDEPAATAKSWYPLRRAETRKASPVRLRRPLWAYQGPPMHG